MDKSLFVKLIGFPATLVHGDTLVLDRWLWLSERLPRTANGETLMDLGCGTGAFTIGAAKRGYTAVGFSENERNQRVAAERAQICGAETASFGVMDARTLDARSDLVRSFDFVVCCEVVEHILDDRKLFRDIAACLKPGGRLLLTAPNYHYRAMTPGDDGPFEREEHGWHVRRGYTKAMFEELCDEAGLLVDSVSSCSGLASQKVTTLMRLVGRVHPALGWASVLGLRALPPLVDGPLRSVTNWPDYSIGLEAYKPRYGEKTRRAADTAQNGHARASAE